MRRFYYDGDEYISAKAERESDLIEVVMVELKKIPKFHQMKSREC